MGQMVECFNSDVKETIKRERRKILGGRVDCKVSKKADANGI